MIFTFGFIKYGHSFSAASHSITAHQGARAWHSTPVFCMASSSLRMLFRAGSVMDVRRCNLPRPL